MADIQFQTSLSKRGFVLTRGNIPTENIPTSVQRITVYGDSTIGDIPPATYRKALTSEYSYEGVLTSLDGAKWVLDAPEYYPEWFGAKGDCVEVASSGSTTANSATFTWSGGSFTSADVGKYIMIAGAGNTRQHATTISAVANATSITLANVAITTVSNTAFFYGTPDDTAMQRMLNFASSVKGTAAFTANKNFLLRNAPLLYRDNTTVRIRGNIIHANGHGGGGAIHDQWFRQGDYNKRTNNVRFYFEGGAIVFPDAWTSDAGGQQKKGLMITQSTNVHVHGARVIGHNGISFSIQIFRSEDVTCIGTLFNRGKTSPDIGSDGVHITGGSRIILDSMNVISGDDAMPLTCETNTGAQHSLDAVIEDVTITNSIFQSRGFSAFKILNTATTGAAQIRRITLDNCILRCFEGTNGQLVIVNNEGYAQGARIEDITVQNCTLDLNTTTLQAPQVAVMNVKNFKFINNTVKGTRGNFMMLYGCVSPKVRGNDFIQTWQPSTIVSGLTVSTIEWSSGSTVVYSFSGSPNLSSVTTSHWLSVSGASNVENNGILDITAVDNSAKTITVTNYRITDATKNETTGATCSAISVNPEAAIRINFSDRVAFNNNRIEDFYGNDSLIQFNNTGNTNPYTNSTSSRSCTIRNNEFINCVSSAGIISFGLQNSKIDGNISQDCYGSVFLSEQSSSSNNSFTNNEDLNNGFGRTGSILIGSGSNHWKNKGNSGDDIIGTITIANNATSANLVLSREKFMMSSDGSDLKVQWLEVKPKNGIIPTVSLSGTTYTITANSAVVGNTTFDYRLRS